MASLRGQKGLVWGRAEASWSGGDGIGGREPHNDTVLNITKYLKRHIVFHRTQLGRFPVLKGHFKQGDLFCRKKGDKKKKTLAGRKLSDEKYSNIAAMQIS